EVRQYAGIVPARVAECRPVVVIRCEAPVVDHAVDRARSSERAPLRGEDRPSRGAFAGQGAELPGNLGIEQEFDDAGRDADQWMGVWRPGFEHTDGDIGILGQPRRQDAARRAGADDYIIERIGWGRIVE